MPDPDEKYERPKQARDRLTGKSAAAARMHQQHLWVDLQVKQAMERGEFDNLPGAGKPIKNLGTHDDPDWWVKQLVEREKITVLPPSLQLRKEDAELDARLDRMGSESEVREAVEEFNERVIAARYRPSEGPPLITMPRDVEETVAAWRERRRRSRTTTTANRGPNERRRRWWRRAGPVSQ